MKKYTILIIAVLLALALSLAGCAVSGKSAYELAVENGYDGTVTEWLESLKAGGGGNSIASVQKTATVGLVDTYTITYTDGTTSTFSITNGEDGEYAGAGLSAYELAVENGFEGTIQDWLNSLQAESDTSNTIPVSTSKAILSVVSVFAKFEVSGATTTPTQAGAGVIIGGDKSKGDAYIITNFHVLYYAEASYNPLTGSTNSTGTLPKTIKVFLYGYEVESAEIADYGIAAKLVGASMTNDIAVLKITGSDLYKNSASRVADIADSSAVVPGDTAIAIGNPEAKGIAATTGSISKNYENITMTLADNATTGSIRVMRYDTSVNQGNSGGGLFNAKGELIGIVNAKDKTAEDFNYAIPSNMALSVAHSIMRNCNGDTVEGEGQVLTTSVCTIGMTTRLKSCYSYVEEATGLTRIKYVVNVVSVTAGSIADGKIKVGDVITSFSYDGKTHAVDSPYTMTDCRFDWVKDSQLTLNLERDGAPLTVTLTLSKIDSVN